MEEYRLAIDADPSSEFLTSGLAELYVKTGRIRDAVLQAQDHHQTRRSQQSLKLTSCSAGFICVLSASMPGQPATAPRTCLKLAIEQYEEIVKIEAPTQCGVTTCCSDPSLPS